VSDKENDKINDSLLELSRGTMDILDALPLVLPHLQEFANLKIKKCKSTGTVLTV
jgi:hypothetical protein